MSRQPVIYLQAFNNLKLLEVSEKVRNIHGKVYKWNVNEKVTDSFINKLIKEKTNAFDREISITPRGFLRMLIDILDKSETYPEYIPEKEFKFDENIIKKIINSEKEESHIMNF